MNLVESGFSARVGRFLRHVRNGTLIDRLRFGWEANRRDSFVNKWQRGMAGPGFVDCRVNDKAKLRLYGDSKLSEQIYFRDFEMKERLFVRRYLRPGDVFIDIGANIGLFAIEAATIVGKGGRVYAFEPNPKVFERLRENVRLNRLKNVSTQQVAVAAEPGSATLKVSTDGYDAWSSLGKPIAGESFDVIEVPVVTFDKFVQEHELGGQVVMVKIDVEGWETSVLQGASACLSAPDAPLLQVEFTRLAALNANSSCEQLFNLILRFGYSLYSYDPSANSLLAVECNLDWDYENLFAIKDINQVNHRLGHVIERSI